jgi:hypothetical protein
MGGFAVEIQINGWISQIERNNQIQKYESYLWVGIGIGEAFRIGLA